MYCTNVFLFGFYLVAPSMQAIDIAKEVDGGVQLLGIGPLELIIPEELSFTIKNGDQCDGYLRMCYVSLPTVSRGELRKKYWNVRWTCPEDSCTIIINPQHYVPAEVSLEQHGNDYRCRFRGEERLWCPPHVINNRINFTIQKLPSDCSIIIDGAKIPNDKVDKQKKDSTIKWIIAVCVALGLLILVIVILVICIFMRPKKKHDSPVHSIRHVHQVANHKTSLSNRPVEPIQNSTVSPSQKTPISSPLTKSKKKIQRLSNSAASE